MRIFLTSTILLFSFISCYSQTDTDAGITDLEKNELRVNVISFIAFSGLEADYEYLFSEEASFGVSLLTRIGNPDDLDLIRNFSITPYYRQYFSRRYARGFFVEGFGMILRREETFLNFFNGTESEEVQRETNVALGISVGGKFLTKGGFVAEVFTGIGRTLSSDDDFFFSNIIARGGISLGYRF
ncbi:MAG: DUF3575 domain-containing protein [Croceivirga sp.]